MTKPRPPELHGPSSSDNYIGRLKRLTNLMLRQTLRGAGNNYPRFFYKYLSCDMAEEHIRCLLIDSDFYLGSCTDFNDPFDTTANVVNNGTIKDMRKRFGQIVDNNYKGLNKKVREVEISKLMSNYAKNPDTFKKILEKNTQEAGIFSLTENKKDLLMWSHYASQHKGFLLQFELSQDIESLLYALKMDYSNNYPEYEISKGFEESSKAILLRKSKHWEYEKEWRILRIGGARTYQQFKPQALKSLIFGYRAKQEFKTKVIDILKERELLGYNSIKVYKAEMHRSKYDLKYFKYA